MIDADGRNRCKESISIVTSGLTDWEYTSNSTCAVVAPSDTSKRCARILIVHLGISFS